MKSILDMNEAERKRCPKCNIIKVFGDFHKNKRRKLGLAGYCKECVKIKSDIQKNTIRKPKIQDLQMRKKNTSSTEKKFYQGLRNII